MSYYVDKKYKWRRLVHVFSNSFHKRLHCIILLRQHIVRDFNNAIFSLNLSFYFIQTSHLKRRIVMLKRHSIKIYYLTEMKQHNRIYSVYLLNLNIMYDIFIEKQKFTTTLKLYVLYIYSPKCNTIK